MGEGVSDEPTIISLYDTVGVLEKKNPNWRDDRFCCMIFAWQADFFLESHSEEVCKEKCPELFNLCLEYHEHKTMLGLALSPFFGIAAMEYIFASLIEKTEYERFGCAPVRDAYFKIDEYGE